MNEQQLAVWTQDARACLYVTHKYTSEEIDGIMYWFKNISGSAERGLVGDAAVDAHVVMIQSLIKEGMNYPEWLYFSLMSRLFIYAPLIVKEFYE